MKGKKKGMKEKKVKQVQQVVVNNTNVNNTIVNTPPNNITPLTDKEFKKEQKLKKKKWPLHPVIVAAVITALASIIVAEIKNRNQENTSAQQEQSDIDVFENNDNENHLIESDSIQSDVVVNNSIVRIDSLSPLPPISFEGERLWGSGLTVNISNNIITVNGMAEPTAGFSVNLMDTGLRSKTVVLTINAGASEFTDNRMFKIEVNEIQRLVTPVCMRFVGGEYFSTEYTELAFILPSNFDGTLRFTFQRARLHNLRITAAIRD